MLEDLRRSNKIEFTLCSLTGHPNSKFTYYVQQKIGEAIKMESQCGTLSWTVDPAPTGQLAWTITQAQLTFPGYMNMADGSNKLGTVLHRARFTSWVAVEVVNAWRSVIQFFLWKCQVYFLPKIFSVWHDSIPVVVFLLY